LQYLIRKAVLQDRATVQELIASSARGLSQGYYTEAQIEAAIAVVFGVDTDLIEDGTYFVVEDRSGKLIGCGGWSRRRNLFGGDQFQTRDSGVADPVRDPAKIRAFFVHPDFARQGIGKAILSRCEEDARAQNFRSLELMATLPGIPLYETCGYIQDEPYDLDLGAGIKLELVKMHKSLI
jgi:GNAT superfamily N-acetyltransferase